MTATERHFLLDLAHFIFGRTLRVTVIAGLTIGSALAYNAAYGPSYTASMRVLVTPSAGNLAMSGAELGTREAATLVVQDHGQTARNQAELLGDPGLIRKLLPNLQALPRIAAADPFDRLLASLGQSWRENGERLGLLVPASDAERYASRLSHALSVAAVGDTDVIKLDFTWNDRVFAAGALNVIVAGYQRSIAETVDARASLQRAQTALATGQAELTAADTHLADAKSALRTAQAGTEAGDVKLRLDTERASADAMRVEHELVRRKLAAAEQSYKTGGWVDAGDAQQAGQSKLAQNFADLLKKRQALASQGAADTQGNGDTQTNSDTQANPDSEGDAKPPASADPPATAAIDKQIIQLREQNYRHVKSQLAAQLGAVETKLTAAEAGIAHDEDALRTIDSQNAQIQMLSDARPARVAALADAKRLYATARQGIDASWQEVGGTRALSQAFPPTEPNWPQPPLLLKLSIVLGFAGGLASALWSERHRRTIDRPIDISRRLGIDVLARLDDVKLARMP